MKVRATFAHGGLSVPRTLWAQSKPLRISIGLFVQPHTLWLLIQIPLIQPNRINILPCLWRTWNSSYSPKITQFKSCSGIHNQPCLMPNILFSNSSPSATSQVSLRFPEKRKGNCYRTTEHLRPRRPPEIPGCFWKALASDIITECKVRSSAAPSAVLYFFGLRGCLSATWSIFTCLEYTGTGKAHSLFVKEGKECCLSPFPWMSRPVDPSKGSISICMWVG